MSVIACLQELDEDELVKNYGYFSKWLLNLSSS